MLTGTLPFRAADPMEWMHCASQRSVTLAERPRALPWPFVSLAINEDKLADFNRRLEAAHDHDEARNHRNR